MYGETKSQMKHGEFLVIKRMADYTILKLQNLPNVCIAIPENNGNALYT